MGAPRPDVTSLLSEIHKWFWTLFVISFAIIYRRQIEAGFNRLTGVSGLGFEVTLAARKDLNAAAQKYDGDRINKTYKTEKVTVHVTRADTQRIK